jgi:hypothetical protein
MRLSSVFLATLVIAGCGGDAFSGGGTGVFAGNGGASGASGSSGSSGSASGGAAGSGANAGAAGVGTGGATGSSGGSTGSGGESGSGATAGAAGSQAGGAPGTGGATTGAGGVAGSRGGASGAGGGTSIDAGPAGGSGGAGGNPSTGYPECTTAADCELFTDCCSCLSVPKGSTNISCKMNCLQSDCAARKITSADVTCSAGRCVFAKSCNEKEVMCNGLAPTCATVQGMTAVVVGGCYSGTCIPVSECSAVTNCDVCTNASLSCATFENLGGPKYQCVSTPEKCVQAPTCACMGVCNGGFQCSQPASKDLACICPAC